MSGQLVTVGEALVALAPAANIAFEDASSYHAFAAGAELNTCIAVRRLGMPCSFVTRIGNDGPGRIVQRALRIEDLDGGYTDIDPVRPTGLYLREWLPDGARRVTYYRRGSAASALGCGSEPRLPAVGPDDVALLTGITLALGDGPQRACRTLAAAARAAGARIAFDPNYRPALWASEHAARNELIGFIGLVDVLLLSEDDAALLYGSTEPDLVLAAALAHGPRVVVYKRGERGAAIATSMGDRFDEPAAPVRLALDPVGAGDGFNGGFVAGLLGGLGLAAATTLGAYVGARAVEAVGDHEGYPRPAELPADLQAMFETGPVGTNQLPTSQELRNECHKPPLRR